MKILSFFVNGFLAASLLYLFYLYCAGVMTWHLQHISRFLSWLVSGTLEQLPVWVRNHISGRSFIKLLHVQPQRCDGRWFSSHVLRSVVRLAKWDCPVPVDYSNLRRLIVIGSQQVDVYLRNCACVPAATFRAGCQWLPQLLGRLSVFAFVACS